MAEVSGGRPNTATETVAVPGTVTGLGGVARRAWRVYWPKRLGELRMGVGVGEGAFVADVVGGVVAGGVGDFAIASVKEFIGGPEGGVAGIGDEGEFPADGQRLVRLKAGELGEEDGVAAGFFMELVKEIKREFVLGAPEGLSGGAGRVAGAR